MRNEKYWDGFQVVIIVLTVFITIFGICSFQTNCSYNVLNQYGETIKLWGAGVYAHDSYFKAPIFIGSDFTILIVVVPLMIFGLFRRKRKSNIDLYINRFAEMSLLLYYAASIAFGVTYNYLCLAYIALFGFSFYYVCFLFGKLYNIQYTKSDVCTYQVTKGMKVYLIVAGLSLFVAWLPDIISSFVNHTTLELIEVYTTEITYVLDMGIISPLMFVTFYMLKKNKFIGYVLLRMILRVCMGIGILLPMQTVFQLMAGITIPLPALITKVFIFVLLAFFSFIFERGLKNATRYE